jgi:hypothetical protein
MHLLLEEITDLKRKCTFAPYGIAFTKRIARETGVNPVWYTDITANGHEWLMNAVNHLINAAVKDLIQSRSQGDDEAHFNDYSIAQIAPYIEQMGTGPRYRKEFWWEREWRHRGDYPLPARFIIVAPESEHEEIAEIAGQKYTLPVLIDPHWGLEEIIGRLAGFTPAQVGSF